MVRRKSIGKKFVNVGHIHAMGKDSFRSSRLELNDMVQHAAAAQNTINELVTTYYSPRLP